MKRIAALLLALLLSGCGTQGPDSPAQPDDGQAEDAGSIQDAQTGAGNTAQSGQPDGTPSDTGDDADTDQTFTRELSVTVDGGRTLTLVAHCKETAMEGFSTYGTGSIDVLDGETLLQTLDVGAGVLTLEEDVAASSKEVYPTVFDSNYLPSLEDLNFDGAQDILCMCDMGTVNGSYLCWLWDPAQGQFIAGPGLCGYAVEPDPETRQVSVSSRGGWGTYDTDVYVPDEQGALVHVKNIHEAPAEDGSGTPETTVRELVDGQWVEASD